MVLDLNMFGQGNTMFPSIGKEALVITLKKTCSCVRKLVKEAATHQEVNNAKLLHGKQNTQLNTQILQKIAQLFVVAYCLMM